MSMYLILWSVCYELPCLLKLCRLSLCSKKRISVSSACSHCCVDKEKQGVKGYRLGYFEVFFNWSTAPFPSRVARHHRSGRLLSFGRLRRRGTLWRSAPGSKKPTASIVMDVAVQDDGFHPSIEARCIRALDACHRSGKRSRASPWAQSLQLRRTTASINQLHLVLFLPLW